MPPMMSSITPSPVRLIILAIQHVLVMYAGAVAVPLILGAALKLPKDQIALLINADLFACGIATFIQAFGVGPIGIRLPVMMGVTFASLSPMLAMANNAALGLNAIFGSVIAAGIFGVVIAPFISRLLRFFPSVVTGSIITVIGITLMRIGINWIGGGRRLRLILVHRAISAWPSSSLQLSCCCCGSARASCATRPC